MAEGKPVTTCPACGAMGTKPVHRPDCPAVKRFSKRWSGPGGAKGPEPQGGKDPRK